MELWSWALTAIGISGIYLAGSNNKVGWLLGLFAQILWLIFAVSTEQYGFIFSAFAYGIVYSRNFMRWQTAKKGPEVNPDGEC